MCGIFGTVNYPIDSTIIKNALYHRGPDAQTEFIERNITFIHTRLAIQDIQSGLQPMEIGNDIIIFNGEIYNHLELRQQFDLICTTRSDTETLLRLFQKIGITAFSEVDGMFAVAIYSRIRNTLLLARDRAGKKPLYYFADSEKFIFSSELRALRKAIPLEIDQAHISLYLRVGFPLHATPYKEVKELEAGASLEIELDSMSMKYYKWWSIDSFYLNNQNIIIENPIKMLDNFLHQSVKRRLESTDIEVGAFLSGGIDSGLVTAIASKYHKRLKTFTVSFSGQFDETNLAKLVADKYKTDHHEIHIKYDHLQQDIVPILENYGEPFFDSSAIPSYYVSKKAKEYLTVILNGDGADELFGGYRRHALFSKINFFGTPKILSNIAKLIYSCIPFAREKASYLNYISRMFYLASRQGADVYLAATVDAFQGFESEILGIKEEYYDDFEKYFHSIMKYKLTPLQKIMLLDFNIALFSELLVKMDIATMAHSLETRSPFLSKDIMEFAPTIEDKYKIHGGSTKWILRELAIKYLPQKIIVQPKRGFEIPLIDWVNGMLRPVINDYLLSEKRLNQYVNPQFVTKIMDNKIHVSPFKRAKIIWKLFTLAVWLHNE